MRFKTDHPVEIAEIQGIIAPYSYHAFMNRFIQKHPTRQGTLMLASTAYVAHRVANGIEPGETVEQACERLMTNHKIRDPESERFALEIYRRYLASEFEFSKETIAILTKPRGRRRAKHA